MKKWIHWGLISVASLWMPVNATTRIEIPSSFNPVGSGARALGFGGSFIAMADDATAASWNPGALTEIEQANVALVHAYVNRTESNQFSLFPEANGKQEVNRGNLNYLALSWPCSAVDCGRNMVFSVNYQRLYEMYRNWQFVLNRDEGDNFLFHQNVNYDQQGALYALGLAYALQINPIWSFGLTINFWQDALKDSYWKQDYKVVGTGELYGTRFEELTERSLDYRFNGTNFHFGLLYKSKPWARGTRRLTIGAVYKSAFEADLVKTENRVFNKTSFISESFPGRDDIVEHQQLFFETKELQIMPKSLGVGVALQWSEFFTTSLDITRTDWSRFAIVHQDGRLTSPLSGKALNDANIKDTTQYRLGLEYRLRSQKEGEQYNRIWPLRFGIFKDPAAAEQNPDDTYGLAIGSGIAYPSIKFDIAYQYRWSSSIGQSALSSMGFSQEIDEHTLYGSVYVLF